jgi:hypothetical protein
MPNEDDTGVIVVWLLLYWDILNPMKTKVGTNVLDVFIARFVNGVEQ